MRDGGERMYLGSDAVYHLAGLALEALYSQQATPSLMRSLMERWLQVDPWAAKRAWKRAKKALRKAGVAFDPDLTVSGG